MDINNFENPKNIIDKVSLVDAEKIAPIENAKTFREEMLKLKEELNFLRKKQKELADELDKEIDLIDENRVNYNYEESHIFHLQSELMDIITDIDIRMEKIKNIKTGSLDLNNMDRLEVKN
ncbi:hypothetical protein JXK06_00235 [Patescibacteria group bacterium]|nr:hypothetical protein [Patescibacteria group bacterium]